MISVLSGIKRAVSADTVVRYAQGCDQTGSSTDGFADAVQAARLSDVVVMVLGDKSEVTTGEGRDRADLSLTGVQEDLLETVSKVGKPVVLVLVTGKPCTVAWAAAHVPAILETWYPGEQGGIAAAEVLFGDYNPAGRLPMTFPRSTAQLPLYYNYKPSGRAYSYTDISFTPLFRFGYGLSYTHFTYGNLQIVPPSLAGGDATVSASVTNAGTRAGDEVAQLYISQTFSSVVTPVMELKGFQRLHLVPGQTSTVTFRLTPYDLSVLNRTMDRVLETGPIKIMVGGASPEALTGDGQKQKIGYADPDHGVVGELNIMHGLSARFVYALSVPPKSTLGKPFQAIVRVKNNGGMTDIGDVKLFADGLLLATQRFEAIPGQIKTLNFPVTLKRTGTTSLCAAGKYALVTKTVLNR